MPDDIGYINVVVGGDLKMEYTIALKRKKLRMKEHITNCMQSLIDEVNKKEVKKKK